MTGQRWDGRAARGRVGPLSVSTPTRLPGGLWGPAPITGSVTWDANGFPINPATGTPSAIITIPLTDSQSLLQTEWPIPTRWELQIGLDLACLAGGPATWNADPGALRIIGSIQSSVESASVVQPIDLFFGPGVYPLQAAVNGVPGLGSTFPVVGQTVRVRIERVIADQSDALSGKTWGWTVNALAGLTSAGWPNP